MDPSQAQLSPAEEKLRYDEHQNIESEGYRNLFSPLREQLKARLTAGSQGLDYGCGPTQYLMGLLNREDGYKIAGYDPYYFFDTSVLKPNFYDFVVCTEVVEHFYQPKESFLKMMSCLKPGGAAFVLTSPPPESLDEFANWFYRRDVTHVGFFGIPTMKYLAKASQSELLLHEKNLWIFTKNI